METLTYTGKVENGELRIINRKRMDIEVKRFEGKEVEIAICKKEYRRSTQLNRYYWGVCVKMIRDFLIQSGYKVTTDDTHEWLKYKFLMADIPNIETGEVMKVARSTSKLKNSEMMDYIEEIKQFAAEELSLYIPDPNE